MQSVAIRVDVTQASGATSGQEMAATVHFPETLPETLTTSGRQIVIFAVPGGGYSQHYFDMRFPGHEGYSEAEYHCARGLVMVTVDHLCVGESTCDLVGDLTFQQAADTYASCVAQILQRLKAGDIDPALPAIADPFVVGIGQSLGGGVTIAAQSRHRSFHAIAALGKSALHTTLPQPTFALFDVQRSIFYFDRTTPVSELSVTATSQLIPDFVYPFHWPEEPQDIIDADIGAGFPHRDPARTPQFASATVPRYAVAMMSPAFMTPDAARVEVPVLIAGGVRDVMPDVRREPTAFINSDDISVFVVQRMAHMHNFAPTRQRLWQRTADWSEMLARSAD